MVNIPLTDRALFFGDGVYDAAIGRNGKIYLKDLHINRLLSNAKRIGISNNIHAQSVSDILENLIKFSNLSEYFLYIQITRNHKFRKHSAKDCDYNILATIDTFSASDFSVPLSLITVEDLRYFYCDIKTLNLLPSVLAATHADAAGCQEAVFHRGTTVTECAHSNISILKSGKLYTHPNGNLILPGITRARLLCACESLNIPYSESAFSIDDMMQADEIIVSSTTKLCTKVEKVNGIAVGKKDQYTADAICKWLYDDYLDATQ